jgi:WD40 repeat protein
MGLGGAEGGKLSEAGKDSRTEFRVGVACGGVRLACGRAAVPLAVSLTLLARTYQGHSKAIQALGWSCDGKQLASASAASSDVRVWNVESHKEGKELLLEDHKSSVEGLSWSPTNPNVSASVRAHARQHAQELAGGWCMR